jgi:gamma-butyrobetaine dioxygenase
VTDDLRGTLGAQGYVVLHGRDDLREAAAAPWSFAERFLGVRPRMLEQQPIRAVPGGRSFASSRGFTPLHSDSQLHLGAPPDVQVMVCHQHAAAGGETLLLDTWALLDDLRRDDPRAAPGAPRGAAAHPLRVRRRLRPHGSAPRGARSRSPTAPSPPRPTRSRRPSRPGCGRAPTVALGVRAGEVLVVDNRRMLHGRKAFDDTARSFTRLLLWLPSPLAEHPGYTAMARAVTAQTSPVLAGDDPRVRARYGALAPASSRAEERLQTVMAMLRGVAPGVLAHHTGVPEPVLYQWRDAALTAALAALDEGRRG